MTALPAGADGAPSHFELVEMARGLPKVASTRDHAALSREAASLLEAWVRHAEAERWLVHRLPRTTARLIENGQRRVVDHLVSLVLEADLDEDPCMCIEHAQEVSSLIEIQIISEEWDQTPG